MTTSYRIDGIRDGLQGGLAGHNTIHAPLSTTSTMADREDVVVAREMDNNFRLLTQQWHDQRMR